MYRHPKEKLNSLDQRSCEAIMLWYEQNKEEYKLWDITENQIAVSRDVTFEESPSFVSVKSIPESDHNESIEPDYDESLCYETRDASRQTETVEGDG